MSDNPAVPNMRIEIQENSRGLNPSVWTYKLFSNIGGVERTILHKVLPSASDVFDSLKLEVLKLEAAYNLSRISA